jgi:uncharacterized protein (TIGR03437 family)
LYTSDRQINFLVPRTASLGEAELVVTSAAASTAPVKVNVQAYAPGIFFDAATGAGAILIAGTGRFLPAASDDGIEIYCTGLGLVRPSSIPGLEETVATPRLLIGGVEAAVLFSGLAPGFPGLYQVNARVPRGLAAPDQPLRLSIGGVDGNEVRLRVR